MIATSSVIIKYSLNFSSNNINYIIALITMQIPLCIYVLDKSSGVLKYNFIRKEFCKKTKVILITELLLIALFLNILYTVVLKEAVLVFFIIVGIDIAIASIIFIEYTRIIKNIAYFNDEENINKIIVSAIDDSVKKKADIKTLHEVFEFVVYNENDKYYSVLLKKLKESQNDNKTRLDIALSNYVSETFAKKYEHLMNYATYKTIHDENSICQLIEKSIKDLQRIEILRNLSLVHKDYSNFSFYQMLIACYIGNVHMFYYEHNAKGRYSEQIANSFHYFDMNIGVFLWYYDIAHKTMPNIFIYLGFLLRCGDCENITKLLTYFRKSDIAFDNNTKNEILHFYLRAIEIILWAKIIPKENKVKFIVKIKEEVNYLFDSTDFEKYIMLLYHLLKHSSNNFDVLIDKVYFEDKIDINIFEIFVCSYSWLNHYSNSLIYSISENNDVSSIIDIKDSINKDSKKKNLLLEYKILEI